MPRISVIMASYNHERYIRECIQSILDQTFQDFEIIITDDGSRDGTVPVIGEFKDPRIHLTSFPENRGACVAANNSLRRATGQFVALLNSDDAWKPTKLQEQMDFMGGHPDIGACFAKVTFVDESSRVLKPQEYEYSQVFEVQNRPRSAWLSHFFSRGNCLCHPSILIRRKCYDEIGPYDERLASVPDLDAWVRLCLKYDIHILPARLVLFRIRAHGANASSDVLPNQIRCAFEYKQILDHYLTINDPQFFLEVFPQAAQYGEVRMEHIPYFLARVAIGTGDRIRALWGLEILHGLLADRAAAGEMERRYGFRIKDLHRMTSEQNAFNLPSRSPLQSLYRLPPRIMATIRRRY